MMDNLSVNVNMYTTFESKLIILVYSLLCVLLFTTTN